MKAWIMHPYWPINKQQSSKLYKKFKWGNTFQSHGITRLIQFTTIMVIVFTFANSVLLSLIYQNN